MDIQVSEPGGSGVADLVKVFDNVNQRLDRCRSETAADPPRERG